MRSTSAPPAAQREIDGALNTARTHLGRASFAREYAAGETLSVQQAIELASAADERRTADGAPPSKSGVRPGGLTKREVEVVRLVAQGLTDREIAEVLVIAEGTAGVHMYNI